MYKFDTIKRQDRRNKKNIIAINDSNSKFQVLKCFTYNLLVIPFLGNFYDIPVSSELMTVLSFQREILAHH